MASPQNGFLNKETYMSVGLVVVLAGALVSTALWISNEVAQVRLTILPKISSMEAELRGIGDALGDLKAQMRAVPSVSEVRGLVREAMSEVETRREARLGDAIQKIEAKIGDHEARIRKLEGQ